MTRRRLSARSPRVASEPDLSPAYKRAIERALRWAWAEVCVNHADLVKRGTEEQITERIQWMLNLQTASRQRAAPSLRLFETVSRGAKVRTVGGRIEKAPDLVFRPPVPTGVTNRSDWGMFVECKIVDGSDSVRLYCKEGIRRFTAGEYCARMPCGTLVAYVRDGSQPFATLGTRISAYAMRSHSARRSAPDASDSVHDRTGLSTPCVDIALAHLWFTP
jgi:hypothetical protein